MGSERLPILSRSAEPTALQSQDGTISRSGLCEREHLPNRLRGHSADRPLLGSGDGRFNTLKRLERVKGIGPSTRSLGSYAPSSKFDLI